ncbi:hypothetical protein [Aeromonas salmonicida]|uniref:hypothetical protein n=1 Tax=Aeromonas salmonicida TaxID=645 RepID=UPI000A977042|nr:hypothetical protein [Aeromonas salmonicida]
MSHPPKFDEAELVTLIDRLVRSAPGLHGGRAKVRQITQKQERYRGGYDAVVSSVLPFYVQAKTATFHPEHSTSNIISGRKALRVNSSPGAFSFYLRKHQGTTEPLQHNALYWMSLRSMAAYVCPTFLSEKTLDTRLDEALNIRRHEVWSYQQTDYHEPAKGQIAMIRARHFAGLVTIVPHRLVDHYLHRYSYDKNSNPDVVFHSDPEKVSDSRPFSEFFSAIEFDQRNIESGNSNLFKPVHSFRELQLQWLEESFDSHDQQFSVSLSDISHALYAAQLSSSTRFRSVGNAMKYLGKLDWLDLAAFWGALFSEKFAIRQFMAFELID